MIVKSCKFVEASDVFKDCGLAWNIFTASDPQCTWGDNNRTMVDKDVVYVCLNDAEADSQAEADQIDVVLSRIRQIDPHTYIDLEN